jgi:hypothetical protein
VYGQLAFARAAQGARRDALSWAGRTLRRRPTEPRAYLASAVALRLASADGVMDALHRWGRGI